MDLELINVELSESVLYRSQQGFRRLSGEEIAELLYLHTLSVYLMSQTERSEVARNIARRTSQYNRYTLFRTSATDLFTLGYAVSNPSSLRLKFKDSSTKSYLEKLPFNEYRHIKFLKEIASDRITNSEANRFLVSLENQLRIKSSVLRRVRRAAVNWDNLSRSQKSEMIKALDRQLRLKSRQSEMSQQISSMAGRSTTSEPKPKSDTLKRAAAAGIGAYAGSKVLPKVSSKISPKAGAGIGAVAAYWASGRNRNA